MTGISRPEAVFASLLEALLPDIEFFLAHLVEDEDVVRCDNAIMDGTEDDGFALIRHPCIRGGQTTIPDEFVGGDHGCETVDVSYFS